MNLQSKIEYSIALLRKCEQMALDYDLDNGFYLAFSGGKDSQVLYHLAVMAGVKFKAHMNLTSIDHPDVIRFVKRNYPDVELIKPKMSIYDMALKKHIIPTRMMRWCCAEFKEMSGAGKVTLIGIRKAESVRRSKREEIEISSHKFSGNFDQFPSIKKIWLHASMEKIRFLSRLFFTGLNVKFGSFLTQIIYRTANYTMKAISVLDVFFARCLTTNRS